MLSYPRSLRSSLHKIVRACGGCAEWPTGSIIAHASASAADGPAANVRNQASSLCDLANDFKLIKQFKGFHRARIDQAAPGFVQCVLKHRFAAHMGGIEPAIARASPGSLRFKSRPSRISIRNERVGCIISATTVTPRTPRPPHAPHPPIHRVRIAEVSM